MHGVPNIFNHDMSILKVMWLISFLASAGAFAYMTFVTVRQYLVYEVVTKIDTIDETSIRFPKITICSANPFVTDAGLKFVESVLKANRIDDLTNSDILSEAYPAASMSQISMNFASALNLAQTAAYDTNITDSARQSFGLTFDQMFVSCTFALNECTPDHWVWYYDPQFGCVLSLCHISLTNFKCFIEKEFIFIFNSKKLLQFQLGKFCEQNKVYTFELDCKWNKGRTLP
jgi:hypothetical protein